jgi:outer membrane protein OmpA-like peptidoglycan-associated protein
MEGHLNSFWSLRFSWLSAATLLVAACLFTSGRPLMAQAANQMPSASAPDFGQNVKEVYFPFNIYNRVIDPAVLDSDAEWLKQHPDAHLWIQGYADVRGDIVYNLVLSYRRAQFVKSKFVERGVNESQIGFATGWGKLYPVCEQADEACFQKNRRADVIPPALLPLS